MYTPRSQILANQLQLAPKKPGVYIFRESSGKVLYIGKAVNLYNRSRSYFQNYRRLDPRLQVMVEKADLVEYLVLANEVEALLLETNLIKKYDPEYNVLMRDDKNYLWIKVTRQYDFPNIKLVRTKKSDSADYFGPYPLKSPIRRILKDLRKIFPYCNYSEKINISKSDTDLETYENLLNKPCFHFHLGLCPGSCVGKINRVKYRENINNIKRFLRSDQLELKKDIETEMLAAAEKKNFELAAQFRDRLRDLNYITKISRISEDTDEHRLAEIIQDSRFQGIQEIVERLNLDVSQTNDYYEKFRIECYDISNIQGTNATGSMVVTIGGNKQTSHYRKFKIKIKSTPDDFAMLQEVLSRRFKYLTDDKAISTSQLVEDNIEPVPKNSFNYIPDLIIIDGGKGQLSSVLNIRAEFIENNSNNSKQLSTIPIAGLAKREEEIFTEDLSASNDKQQRKFKLVKFSSRSAALRLLQLVRDEAHRFGLGYHRLLRSKGMVYSELDLIPGVGKQTKTKLVQAFGSLAGIKKASLNDLESVVRNKNTARLIKKFLK